MLTTGIETVCLSLGLFTSTSDVVIVGSGQRLAASVFDVSYQPKITSYLIIMSSISILIFVIFTLFPIRNVGTAVPVPKVWTLVIVPLTWVSSALQSRKWQLIGMSQWCHSALCDHPLPALTDNWTHGAASSHTIAPISHISPSTRSHSYYSFFAHWG